MITYGITDPKQAIASTKPQLQIVPPVLKEQTAKALTLGQTRYGPFSWREHKIEYMTYIGAMQRHIDKITDRVDTGDIDPESGAHHLGHVAATCGIILDALNQGMLIDNRPRQCSTVS